MSLGDLDSLFPQYAGEVELPHVLGHGCDGGYGSGRLAPYGHGHGHGPALGLPEPLVASPAPVREPPHDEPLRVEELQPVDPHVIGASLGPPGHHEGPGHKGRGVPWPALYYREL